MSEPGEEPSSPTKDISEWLEALKLAVTSENQAKEGEETG